MFIDELVSAADSRKWNTHTHTKHTRTHAKTHFIQRGNCLQRKHTHTHTGGGSGYENDSDDDSDAGPIEITKQASRDGGLEGEGGGGGEGDAGDGAGDIEPPVPGEEGEGEGDGKKNSAKHMGGGNGVANKAEAGVSSSELRAQQGKEDRPVFDMFSAAALPAAGGPGGKMGGKGGNGGAHGMSFLAEDGGGDQVRLLNYRVLVLPALGGCRWCRCWCWCCAVAFVGTCWLVVVGNCFLFSSEVFVLALLRLSSWHSFRLFQNAGFVSSL